MIDRHMRRNAVADGGSSFTGQNTIADTAFPSIYNQTISTEETCGIRRRRLHGAIGVIAPHGQKVAPH